MPLFVGVFGLLQLKIPTQKRHFPCPQLTFSPTRSVDSGFRSASDSPCALADLKVCSYMAPLLLIPVWEEAHEGFVAEHDGFVFEAEAVAAQLGEAEGLRLFKGGAEGGL